MKAYNEIIKLLEAGFTHEEILAMEEQQPEPEPAPEPEQAQPAESPDLAGQLMELIGRMDKKITELQAFNIYTSQQPEQEQHVMTDVEALEEIIRPYRSE